MSLRSLLLYEQVNMLLPSLRQFTRRLPHRLWEFLVIAHGTPSENVQINAPHLPVLINQRLRWCRSILFDVTQVNERNVQGLGRSALRKPQRIAEVSCSLAEIYVQGFSLLWMVLGSLEVVLPGHSEFRLSC